MCKVASVYTIFQKRKERKSPGTGKIVSEEVHILILKTDESISLDG